MDGLSVAALVIHIVKAQSLSRPQNQAIVWLVLEFQVVARKCYSDEDVLHLLREIELKLASGHDVVSAFRSAGVSDATNYNCPRKVQLL